MRILLVEDDEELRYEMGEYLRRRKQIVTACGSLMEARNALAEAAAGAPPEAVVCDSNLPDGNGVDFCVETRPRFASCRWILMSGAHDLEQVESKLSALPSQDGILIVEKPISMRHLSQLLESDPAKG